MSSVQLTYKYNQTLPRDFERLFFNLFFLASVSGCCLILPSSEGQGARNSGKDSIHRLPIVLVRTTGRMINH